MSKYVPDSHSGRIERQDRRDQRKEVEARQKKLEEKHGKATDIVTDSEGRHGMGQTYGVEGADCPDCDDGVIRVVPRPNSYPNFEEICTECGSR